MRRAVSRLAAPCPLDLAVEMRPGAQRLLPIARLIGEHLADQVAADQPLAGSRLGDQARIVEIDGREDALHRPAGPQPPHQSPRVDRFNGDDAGRLQIFGQAALGAKIALHAAVLADDEAGQLRPPALDVLGIDAVVADLRVGHRHDLAAIARIGEDLLVAGHRGVEADFAVDFAIGADRGAGVDGAIFERQFCRF